MTDDDVAVWLARATGSDPVRIAEELALGEQRRAFVLAELTEAGYSGEELVSLLMRLTGLDEREAQALRRSSENRPAVPADETSQRDARLARNEILFRQHNEQFAQVGPDEDAPGVIELVCECSDSSCAKWLSMPFAEYEWLRQNPLRFAVLPGHEAPAVEDVVERHDAYSIVEKHAETHQLVEASDPRASRLARS
jgi:hypothetical protein